MRWFRSAANYNKSGRLISETAAFSCANFRLITGVLLQIPNQYLSEWYRKD